MQPIRANLLYVGPIRIETLVLLNALPTVEHALFVTPSPESDQWQEVLLALPNATQQVTRLGEISGELPYYEFNLPEFNASQPASGLYTLYPGLEVLESAQQPLTSVAELLNELEAQPIDTLVIEQPELVLPSLQAIAADQRYQHIQQLWLRVGTVPLYQGMPEIEEILSWCQDHGFELQARNEEDPDLPLLQLTRHAYYYRWQEEVARSAKLSKQLSAEQKEHQQQLDQYKQLQQKYKKLQQQLAEQEATVTTLQATLEKQQGLETSLAALHKSLDNKFEEQHVYLQKTANALGQHITRCTQDK